MKRKVLAIPLDEIRTHFQENIRQDIKNVAPRLLTEATYQKLIKRKKKGVKREKRFRDVKWTHTKRRQPNLVCPATDFCDQALPQYAAGPFCLAFANKHAPQDEHYHSHHIEIYYSESALGAQYRVVGRKRVETVHLPKGGVLIFGPQVVHKVELQGMTLVLEFPAAESDKKDEKL